MKKTSTSLLVVMSGIIADWITDGVRCWPDGLRSTINISWRSTASSTGGLQIVTQQAMVQLQLVLALQQHQ